MQSGSLTSVQELMKRGQYTSALESLDILLADDTSNADAHYSAAVCLRYLKQFNRAQQHLDAIKITASDKGRVYQEQGYLFRAQNRFAEAQTAFETATQLNSALVSSWSAQLDLCQKLGMSAQVQFVQAQLTYLQKLPPPLISVMDLIAQHKLLKAEALCRKFLQKNPTFIEAMRLLADIGRKLGELEDAEFLLQSAAAAAPKATKLQIEYVQVLRQRHKYPEALRHAENLHRVQPDNPQLLSVYAIELMHAGEYEQAIRFFDRVLAILPKDPVTLTSKGHALKTWGKNADAVAAYQAATDAKASHGEAWYSLANLKTHRFSDADIEAMRTLEEQLDLGPMHKVHLSFALGKAFEDREDYAQSFDYYRRGNYIKRQQSGYDADQMEEELRAQRNFFTPALTLAAEDQGFEAPDPIFIVGLPRAGSTLLEQILSSHSLVDGTLELPNILSMAQQLRRSEGSYPQALGKLNEQELTALGKKYIDDTKIYRQGAPYFIDKMPNNFRHIGLIKFILPNAKIIDARRNAMACCFSGFKQLFAEGQEFSYSLEDIGRYYNDYLALMAHWQKLFPNDVLTVHYEHVVDNLEKNVRDILSFLNLPFEQACLDFHKTKRAVRTASSEQVRQPLYKSGVDQWRHFEPFLDPLKNVLKNSQYDK